MIYLGLECIKNLTQMMAKLLQLVERYKINTIKILVQDHMILVQRDLRTLLVPMQLEKKRGQHNLGKLKGMKIYQAQECIKNLQIMIRNHTHLVRRLKKNTIKTQALEPTMLVLRGRKTQHEFMR